MNLSFLLVERTPYHDTLFQEIHYNNINLDIYYLQRINERRPWKLDREPWKTYYVDNFKQFINTFVKNMFSVRPDLVVVAGFAAPKVMTAYLLLRLLGIHFAFFSDVPRFHIKRSFIKHALRLAILKWIFKNAHAALAMGQPGIESLKILGCPPEKIRNFPCTVDTREPEGLNDHNKEEAKLIQRTHAPKGELIFLCVGRLVNEKAHEIALEAFARVFTQRPDSPAVLLMAGDGPRRKELQELAANLGIAPRVHFLGWRQPEEMKAIFHAADILVNPSRLDNYGVVILEAMSWGLPVLASNQTMAAVDRVRHGESGFIHQAGDSQELSQHMIYLLDNPAEVAAMGEKAKLTAAEWPVSRNVQTILELL
jgi:glycosyltransferase involved in cell wall biosynthesis